MNIKSAKKINAFAHKDLRKFTKPGDLIVECSHGRPTLLSEDKKEYDKFCDGYSYKGQYYKVIEPKTELYSLVLEEYHTGLLIKCIEDQLEARQKDSRANRGIIQKAIANDVKSHIVLFIQKETDYHMTPNEVYVRDGDKLVKLGLRFNNSNMSMWIAIIEHDGLTSKNILSHYIKSRRGDDKLPNYQVKANNTCKLEDTGYKIGEEFKDHVSIVKL